MNGGAPRSAAAHRPPAPGYAVLGFGQLRRCDAASAGVDAEDAASASFAGICPNG